MAGLAGGLVFTVVMVLVDALPTVARMVGSQGVTTGLVVHLVTAQLVGVSYAVVSAIAASTCSPVSAGVCHRGSCGGCSVG